MVNVEGKKYGGGVGSYAFSTFSLVSEEISAGGWIEALAAWGSRASLEPKSSWSFLQPKDQGLSPLDRAVQP